MDVIACQAGLTPDAAMTSTFSRVKARLPGVKGEAHCRMTKATLMASAVLPALYCPTILETLQKTALLVCRINEILCTVAKGAQ